jgi:hypothetical protein
MADYPLFHVRAMSVSLQRYLLVGGERPRSWPELSATCRNDTDQGVLGSLGWALSETPTLVYGDPSQFRIAPALGRRRHENWSVRCKLAVP